MKYNRILAAVAACLMVLGAVFIGLQGKPVNRDSSLYLTDTVGVISDSVKTQFIARQKAYTPRTSPRLSVAIVKSTGKLSTAKYCEALWNDWRLGTSDALLLMVTGKQDYYFGYDYISSFADVLDSNFDLLMERYLEPDFAAGDYEQAILTFSDGIQEVLTSTGFVYNAYNPYDLYGGYYQIGVGSSGISPIGIFLVVAIVIIVIAVISVGSIGRRRRRSNVTPFRPVSRPVPPPPPRPGGRPANRPRPMTPPPPSRPRTTMRTPGSRPSSRPSSFGGGGRSSGGFKGGGRSGGFGGGGRSGGMGGRGRG